MSHLIIDCATGQTIPVQDPVLDSQIATAQQQAQQGMSAIQARLQARDQALATLKQQATTNPTVAAILTLLGVS